MDIRNLLSIPTISTRPTVNTNTVVAEFSHSDLDALSTLHAKQQTDQQAFETGLATQAKQTKKAYQDAVHHTPSLTGTLNQVTGTWLCHACSRTNSVVVIPGAHPLRILKCQNLDCAHVWCEKCPAGSLMRIWYTGGENTMFVKTHPASDVGPRSDPDIGSDTSNNAAISYSQHIEVPYVYLCPHCGLTHRAVISHSTPTEDGEVLYWSFGEDKKCRCSAQPPTNYEVSRPWMCFRLPEGSAKLPPRQPQHSAAISEKVWGSSLKSSWLRKIGMTLRQMTGLGLTKQELEVKSNSEKLCQRPEKSRHSQAEEWNLRVQGLRRHRDGEVCKLGCHKGRKWDLSGGEVVKCEVVEC
jgi:rubrerythrin